MTVPSKTAYSDALAIVAAGDKSLLDTSLPVFQPVIDALTTAQAAIDTARTKYDTPPGASPSATKATLDNWFGSLGSFLGSAQSMKQDCEQRLAAMVPPTE